MSNLTKAPQMTNPGLSVTKKNWFSPDFFASSGSSKVEVKTSASMKS